MSWKPKYSKQSHNEKTCGLHVVAMITHLPYDYIKTVLPKFKGTSPQDVCMTLGILGYTADYNWTKYQGQQLPDLAVVHVRNHWCIWFKGYIYCSCVGIVPFKEYRSRIKHFIKVEIPNG